MDWQIGNVWSCAGLRSGGFRWVAEPLERPDSSAVRLQMPEKAFWRHGNHPDRPPDGLATLPTGLLTAWQPS